MRRKPQNSKTEYREFDIGKIPPQDTEAEMAVLGACLIDYTVFLQTVKILRTEHFYKSSHASIYEAMTKLYDKETPVDVITITDQLRKNGKLEEVGGALYLAQLTNKIASGMNTQYHSMIIIEKYMLREVIRISYDYSGRAYDQEDPFTIIDNMRVDLDDLSSHTSSLVTQNTKTAVDLAFNKMEKVTTGNYRTFYDTGYDMFDEVISISSNEILMLAGPAGHGKTKFIIGLMFRLLSRHKNISVDWYSFEDPMDKIIRAFVASVTGFTDKYMSGKTRKKITKEHLDLINKYRAMIEGFDIEFHEEPMYAKDIRYSFTRFCEKRPGKLHICIIDNMLLVRDRGRGYERDDSILAEISTIRQVTKGLIIPIHHFSDEQQSAERAKLAYRPRLKDMKGSEAYRRVPTQILLINKPGEYKDVVKLYPDRPEMKYLFLVEVAKNRDGETVSDETSDIIRYFADLATNLFYEY